jgi:hypothetical protein
MLKQRMTQRTLLVQHHSGRSAAEVDHQ